MHIGAGLFIVFTAIYAKKLRSLLTMIGIIIGVASVLAMIAIGDGARAIVLEEVRKQGGINQFTMYCVNVKKVGDVWVANRSNEYFKYEDVLAIEAECPSVKLTVPRIPAWGGVLAQVAGGAEVRTGYNGVNATYAEAMDWEIQEGRFISDEDIENAAKVCVLGAEVVSELFEGESPIGKEIKIARGAGNNREKERMTVIGTMMPRQRHLQFGFSLSAQIFIPITTTQMRFTGSDKIEMLTIQTKEVSDIPLAMEEVKATIRKRHRNRDDFFVIWDMKSGMRQLDKISTVIKIALGSIAGFSLLVGGIGIMNMMLVAVSERTREIGLRKAVGAKQTDILLQYLMESVAMCGVGGVLGIGLGVCVSKGAAFLAVKIVKIVPNWPAVISIQWMLISVLFSSVIGIVFGLYPAIKASSLSPIEALRTE